MMIKSYQSNITRKQIFLLSIPVFFSNLAIPLVGIIDTGLMGNLGEAKYLAATSIATSVITMIIWSFGFLRMGTVGIVSQAYGRSDYREIVKTLLIWAPIALASLALLITFSAGLWNIGIEGQIIAGSIGATIIARSALGESIASPYIQIFIGLIFGGLWGLLCGFLRVKFNVHEIFGGLGLDFVASGLIVYLIIGPWKRAGIASTSGTDIFPDAIGLSVPGMPLGSPGMEVEDRFTPYDVLIHFKNGKTKVYAEVRQ